MQEPTDFVRMRAAIEQPLGTVMAVPVPDGFAYEEDLKRVARLAAELLDSGMPVRECLRRLRGWVPPEGG